jgi:hypothetical protein
VDILIIKVASLKKVTSILQIKNLTRNKPFKISGMNKIPIPIKNKNKNSKPATMTIGKPN